MQGNFIRFIVKAADPLLIALGFASFFILGFYATGYLQSLHLSEYSPFVSVCCAVIGAAIIEGARFGFLAASIKDLVEGRKQECYLGFILSTLLVLHDFYFTFKISRQWADPAEVYPYFILMVLIGLAVEVRLILAYRRFVSESDSVASDGEARPASARVSGSRAVGASAPVS